MMACISVSFLENLQDLVLHPLLANTGEEGDSTYNRDGTRPCNLRRGYDQVNRIRVRRNFLYACLDDFDIDAVALTKFFYTSCNVR